ncbi:hypothetical protein C8F01DRAFT_337612 [Mycena amicta]|nr:hypothetical protein C8F01DRAFT_337612 [Mycena amicta]
MRSHGPRARHPNAFPAQVQHPWTPFPLPHRPTTTGCSASSTSKFLAKFSSTNYANITLALSPELGGNRALLVHLPAAYNPSTPHALVVSFHGFKSNALKQERITGLFEAGVLINGKGIVAVYPEGQFGKGKNGNESIRAWPGAPYSPSGVDDVPFTQELLSHLSDNLCLDSNRFLASGKSNGGGFANLLACLFAFCPPNGMIRSDSPWKLTMGTGGLVHSW